MTWWDGIDKETDFVSSFSIPDDRTNKHQHCPKVRKALRDKVENDVAGFLQGGGEIEKLPYAMRSTLDMRDQVKTECWKARNDRHRKINKTLPSGTQKLRSFDP